MPLKLFASPRGSGWYPVFLEAPRHLTSTSSPVGCQNLTRTIVSLERRRPTHLCPELCGGFSVEALEVGSGLREQVRPSCCGVSAQPAALHCTSAS